MHPAWAVQIPAEEAFAAAQMAVAMVKPRDCVDLVLLACLVIEEPSKAPYNTPRHSSLGRDQPGHHDAEGGVMSPRKRTAGPKSLIHIKTDVTPETPFQAIGRLRKEAADEIDRLLAFLDSTEPDPDLEPSLGAG